ncbi:hypothetical protein COD14_15320 [Bacillus cereus]|nr:hypothetical protein COD14_15320 [Bacillus cereus]
MCNLILHKMKKTLHIKFFPESIHRLSFFIAIYFIRKNNRFNISTDNEIIERCTRSHTYKISKPLIINILKKYNIIPDEKDIIIILLAITNSLYRYEKQEIINKEYATHIITSKQFYNLISLLEETFSISLHDDEVFTFSIVCIVAPRLYNSKLFMHNRFLNITDIYIKNKHTKTFKTMKIILTDWIKSFNNEYYINDNDIINLTMQVEAIKMQQHHQKKIILLLNKGENWERYFKAYLNSHFNKQINYVDITYEQLTEEDLNCKEFACIITDVPLANSLKTIPLILISSIPTKRELEEIGKLI